MDKHLSTRSPESELDVNSRRSFKLGVEQLRGSRMTRASCAMVGWVRVGGSVCEQVNY